MAELNPDTKSNVGWKVAVSGDGNTALISGDAANGGMSAGWVFVRSGSQWSQQGSGLALDSKQVFDAVALSADGNTALVGDGSSAWVFIRSDSTWTQQAQLAPSGGGSFGSEVALSGDGNTAVIAGVSGAVVFTRSGTTWTQQGPELVPNGDGSLCCTVALSGDGNTVLLGVDEDNDEVGAVWVFARSGSSWAQQGPELTADDESGPGLFGSSVALAGDGDTALVGGYGDDNGAGAMWTFTRSGSTWTQHGAKFTPDDPDGQADFGFSVAVSGDGDTALIGGAQDGGGAGAAWVFTRSGSTWTQNGPKLTGQGGYFGSSVALSGDGSTAVIGAPNDNSVFVLATVPSVSLSSPTNGSFTNDTQPSFSGTAGTASVDLPSVGVALFSGDAVIQTLSAPVQPDGSYSVQASALLPDGTYTARAEQTTEYDSSGESSYNTFTIDTTPPLISLSSPTNGSFTNDTQPSFSGTAGTASGDLRSVTVDLYSGSGRSGAPIQTLRTTASPEGAYTVQTSAVLAQGTYTAQAQQSDEAGNTGYSSANTFTVDTTPPDVTITQEPASPGNNASPSFSFASSDPTATFECSLDGSPPAPCSSAEQYSNLSDGSHTFDVVAVDEAGNVTPIPASDTFVIDTIAPAVMLSTPAAGSTDHYRSPSFSGAAGTATGDQPQITVTVYAGSTASGSPAESVSTTASGGQWSAQSTALGNGTYTVIAQQSDDAGNTGSVSVTFTLDATAPNTTISSGPAAVMESSQATFAFFSSVEDSTFQCQLDGSGWSACSAPDTLTGLADGPHTFQVRATDPWGNTDSTGASETWSVDATPPHTVITSGPSNPTQSTTATLAFFSTRQGSTFQCQLDSSGWSTCTSPATYTNVDPGEHVFAVRATDADGLTDPTPATTSWTVGTFLLASDGLDVISGTTAASRIARPTIDLKTGIATVATAFCSPHHTHACRLKLQLTAPGITTPNTTSAAVTGLAAGAPRTLALGSATSTVRPGRHSALRVYVSRTARRLLKTHNRIHASLLFTLPSGHHFTRAITLLVRRR